MLIWETIMQEPPYSDLTPGQIIGYVTMQDGRPKLDRIPQQLRPLLRSMLVKDPMSRPNAVYVLEELEKFYSSLTSGEGSDEEETEDVEMNEVDYQSPDPSPHGTIKASGSTSPSEMKISVNTISSTATPDYIGINQGNVNYVGAMNVDERPTSMVYINVNNDIV